MTAAAYASYAYADACLGRVVEAVHKAGIEDRTTFLIASDHGFAAFTRTISPNAALLEQDILKKDGSSVKGPVWVKSEGGAAMVYIAKSDCAQFITKAKAIFESIPGVDHVYTNHEAQALGIPSEADTDQAPQLYLTAKPDYAFDDDGQGPVSHSNPTHGAHGYLNSMPEMSALFIASGAAIKPGIALGNIDNLRVAPTIAKILGLDLPDAKEPALTEILR